jgi:predicted metal-dependent enzyme (double-stranded beta helix superfamily)
MTFDRDTFVADCYRSLDEDSPIVAVKELVERTVAQRGVLDDEFERWDLSTHGVVHRSDRLQVQLLLWPPGYRTPIHDHLMWAVVGVYAGGEDNALFRTTGEHVVPSGGKELRDGQVLALGADGAHYVENPFERRWSAAIHVYGGDLFGTKRHEYVGEDLEQRPFDGPKLVAEMNRAFEAASGVPRQL